MLSNIASGSSTEGLVESTTVPLNNPTHGGKAYDGLVAGSSYSWTYMPVCLAGMFPPPKETNF